MHLPFNITFLAFSACTNQWAPPWFSQQQRYHTPHLSQGLPEHHDPIRYHSFLQDEHLMEGPPVNQERYYNESRATGSPTCNASTDMNHPPRVYIFSPSNGQYEDPLTNTVWNTYPSTSTADSSKAIIIPRISKGRNFSTPRMNNLVEVLQVTSKSTSQVSKASESPRDVQGGVNSSKQRERNYHCKMKDCTESFLNKWHLRDHERTHPGIRPFVSLLVIYMAISNIHSRFVASVVKYSPVIGT
jgi:hypothetical protein